MTLQPGRPDGGPQHAHQEPGQLQQHRLHLCCEYRARRGLHLLCTELGRAGQLHGLSDSQPAAQLGDGPHLHHLQARPLRQAGLLGPGGTRAHHTVGQTQPGPGGSNIKVSSATKQLGPFQTPTMTVYIYTALSQW